MGDSRPMRRAAAFAIFIIFDIGTDAVMTNDKGAPETTFRSFRLANLRRCLMLLGLLTMLRPSPAAAAPFVYIANFNTNNVAVIDATSQSLVATIPLPPLPAQCGPGDCGPGFVAITPDGGYAYVTLSGLSNGVAVIDTTLALTDPANAVVAVIPVGTNPQEVAINPDGAHVYVAIGAPQSIAVIDTGLALTNPSQAVMATVFLPGFPHGVAVKPDGTQVLVTETTRQAVAVVDTFLALTNPAAALLFEVKLDAGPSFPDDTPNDVVFAPLIPLAIVTDRYGQIFQILFPPFTFKIVVEIVAPSVGLADPQFQAYGVALARAGVYIARGGEPYVDRYGGIIGYRAIPVGIEPFGVAASYDGTQVYITNTNDSTVSVINTAVDAVVGTISVGLGGGPLGVAVTPTPAQALARTITLVQGLGSLNAGQQTSLIDKLNAASSALLRGNTTAACNQIGAFLQEGDDLVASGQVTAQGAAPSHFAGMAIQISLKCPPY